VTWLKTYHCAVIVEDIARRGVKVEVGGGGLVLAQHWDSSGSGEEKARVRLEIPSCRRRHGYGHELEAWDGIEWCCWTAGVWGRAWLSPAGAPNADLSGCGCEGGGKGEEEGWCGEHVGWMVLWMVGEDGVSTE